MTTRKEWPKNKTHFNMIDDIKEVLQNEENLDEDGEISQANLARKVGEKETVTAGTASSYLSTHNQYLTEKEPFSRRKKPDGTPGSTTCYWSMQGDRQ